MITSNFTECVVEEATLDLIASRGHTILHGPEVAAGEPTAERGGENSRGSKGIFGQRCGRPHEEEVANA
jgi:hypothetical protein